MGDSFLLKQLCSFDINSGYKLGTGFCSGGLKLFGKFRSQLLCEGGASDSVVRITRRNRKGPGGASLEPNRQNGSLFVEFGAEAGDDDSGGKLQYLCWGVGEGVKRMAYRDMEYH